MKKKSLHKTTLGFYSPCLSYDQLGYAEYHDSDRYQKASSEQLEIWCDSRLQLVRNAAKIELASRRLEEYRTCGSKHAVRFGVE